MLNVCLVLKRNLLGLRGGLLLLYLAFSLLLLLGSLLSYFGLSFVFWLFLWLGNRGALLINLSCFVVIFKGFNLVFGGILRTIITVTPFGAHVSEFKLFEHEGFDEIV